jgi:hypothetical protein
VSQGVTAAVQRRGHEPFVPAKVRQALKAKWIQPHPKTPAVPNAKSEDERDAVGIKTTPTEELRMLLNHIANSRRELAHRSNNGIHFRSPLQAPMCDSDEKATRRPAPNVICKAESVRRPVGLIGLPDFD